ncbi:MAG: hypothetical protein IJX65_00610 [Alistipes sp.]|nr:hypothetical protein [Alistipes sp.]
MKKLAILLLFAAVCGSAMAQRVHRSEFSLYDTRDDSVKKNHANTVNHIPYAPQLLGNVDNVDMYGSNITVPASWNDYNVYLHLENTHSAYDIVVNGSVVASCEDAHTPADYFISPYLRQGENQVALLLRQTFAPLLSEGTTPSRNAKLSGCYIFAQHRASVYDYDAAIVARDGKLHLELDIITGNDFNYEETVQVGYDIYTPERKLVDYAVREVTVPGRSRDTLKVRIDLGAELRYLWSAAKPQLYRTTLYVKRNGKPFEYLPVAIGAGRTTFADGKIYRNDKPLTIKAVAYNANSSKAQTRKDIVALKSKGYNTLRPDAPQPLWFYDICDEVGIYVIEQVAVNATSKGDNRAIGGTPSNDPQLVDEYLSRTKSMYYRTRNHPCIIAYSLCGKESGNGYCLYKSYQWLKSVELSRPVLCTSAAGEWNTDDIGL